MKRPLEIGRMQDGLYLLCSTYLHKIFTSTTLRDSNKCLSFHSDKIDPQCSCFSHYCNSLPIVKCHPSDISTTFITTTHNNGDDTCVSMTNATVASHLSHEINSDLLWH